MKTRIRAILGVAVETDDNQVSTWSTGLVVQWSWKGNTLYLGSVRVTDGPLPPKVKGIPSMTLYEALAWTLGLQRGMATGPGAA